jgi:DNA repair exonuclease SbcCD nuclease subunit
MTKLIFTDPHIEEEALEELETIFKEIFKYQADMLIMIGDYYDKRKPTAKEILFGTKWAYFFKKRFSKVIFVKGNHDKTQDISAINYLEYIGIECVDEYIDEQNTFYGHFMTDKSLMEYGTHEKTLTELKQYQYVLLGHQHTFQELAPNIYHLGSCRYINFNEAKDEGKYVMLNYNNIWERRKLEAIIPMIEVYSLKELPNIPARSKVCMVINSYRQFKDDINELNKWKSKFIEFKIKLNFKVETTKIQEAKQEQRKLEEVLRQGINKIQDNDVKQLLFNVMEDKDGNKTVS